MAGFVPPDPNLHWDGQRWLRWNGQTWVDASTGAPVTDFPAPGGSPKKPTMIVALSAAFAAAVVVVVVVVVVFVAANKSPQADPGTSPTAVPSVVPSPSQSPTNGASASPTQTNFTVAQTPVSTQVLNSDTLRVSFRVRNVGLTPGVPQCEIVWVYPYYGVGYQSVRGTRSVPPGETDLVQADVSTEKDRAKTATTILIKGCTQASS